MEIHTLEPILKTNPFFKDMEEPLIEQLVGCATNLRFDEGQYLFREGEPADRFFIIRQGTVSLKLATPQKEEILIERLREGELLGWSWYFSPNFWKFDAYAETLTRVISMDGECIRAKCDEIPKLGYELMKRFAHVVVERLQYTRMQLIESRKNGGQAKGQ